jgi:hypothetical protein
MDPTNRSLTQNEPVVDCALQESNQNNTTNVAATTNSMSGSLKSRKVMELFASSKIKKKNLNGQTTGKPEILMERDQSRKPTRTSSPAPKRMLSTSFHRQKKLMKNPLAEVSSALEGDFELAKKSASPHPTPTESPSYSHTKRSCLKKSEVSPSSRGAALEAQPSFQALLPGLRKPVTRARYITFDERVCVRRVPSLLELSKGSTSDIWFQPQEYEVIKLKTYALIRAIQRGDTGGVNYCTRGLEKYFEAEKVQRARAAARDSVLVIQEGQRQNGRLDDLQMSHVYRRISSQSMAEAAYRGKRDQEYIERYYTRPNTCFERPRYES